MWVSVRRLEEVCVRGEADEYHGGGYWDFEAAERDVSDHYPLVATFVLSE